MVSRKGVPRVVWERRREDPDGGDEKVDLIPFLSVSRALGDFWSFCPSSGNFVVSPTPDVHMHPINPIIMKFVVIASDGLWNVMSPKEVVEFIWDYEEARDEKLHQTRDVVKAIINEALNRWKKKQLVADNISVLIVFIVADDQKAWEGYSPTAPSCAGVVTPAISAALHAINDKSSATAASSVGESSATCSTASSATTTAGSPTPNSDSTGESSASTCTCTVSPASTSAPSSSGMCTCSTVSNNSRECSASTSTVSPPAVTSASPTPNSGSIVNGESGDEVRTNPTPPLTGSPAPLTTSPSSSSSPHSSSMPPSSSLNQSQEQQEQSPSTVSSTHATTSRGDSTCTSHYKETFSDGVIVEFHTKIKHRHRRKHKHRSSRSRLNGTHKDNDAISNCPGTSTCMSSSSFSLDPTGSLKRSPLKRGRTEGEVATASSEPLMKRSKLDLPDSGYDGSGDKMETEEDSSPPSDVAEADHMDHHDQTSSFEHSSGVETDDSQGRNKLAQNSKR